MAEYWLTIRIITIGSAWWKNFYIGFTLSIIGIGPSSRQSYCIEIRLKKPRSHLHACNILTATQQKNMVVTARVQCVHQLLLDPQDQITNDAWLRMHTDTVPRNLHTRASLSYHAHCT